ncbi:MAG: thioredoxin family protein [Gemmatimonadota bacterium]
MSAQSLVELRPLVSRVDWLAARRQLLAEEKAMSKALDALAAKRHALPWVRVDEDYEFRTTEGVQSLADLFAGRGQLVVYHFMFGPDWEEGCPSCSFWADNFDRIDVHLAHRDTTLLAVSNTSVEKIEAYRERMGWSFKWVSSLGTDFNRDFAVTFTPQELEAGGVDYNFTLSAFPSTEAPGLSVFARLAGGGVAHAYSAFARGLDIFNGAYQILDLTPSGRDEGDLPYTQAWIRRRDQYED